MKPHLPTALRRALLAITALLSPAVVTTTIATATLAAITAPAIAEDLTITETKITEDITYNNVTVSSSSAHLYSTTQNANFTAGTLTVNSNGKLVVGSTSYDGSSRFNFNASKFEIETGGSITFVENPQVYATDTLYDLLVGVKQDDSIRVHNTHVYGAGHKDLTSEFLTSKIRHYMVDTNCYLTLTSGDLAINSSFEEDKLTFWVYVGDGNAENGEAKATIADGVEIAHTDTSKKNRLYGLAIYRDGSLNVGKGNNALTLANCDIGGKMVSNRDIVFSNTYFRASNGSEADVTVNGKITFANTSSSTTTVYGALTANGEIAIEGNNYIKLNSSTVLNLGGKINNSGSLTLGGTINLNAANFTHSTASSFDDVAYNGYEVTTTTYLGVITGTGTVAGSATWKVGGNTATYNAGDVTVTTTDKSTYRVSSGNVDLSTVLESNDTNKILLCGGNLVVNTDISSLIPEITTVDGAASTVTINTSLNQNALTATDDRTITLCGTGSYVINGTDLSMGTGIMISDSEWSGTVKTTGATAVSGAVNTTGWNNTELNGTTTVNNGATLTLGGDVTLKGQIANSGTLTLSGNITIDVASFADGTVTELAPQTYQQGSSLSSTTSGFATGGSIKIDLVTGNAAAVSGANWTVGNYKEFSFDGNVLFGTVEQPGTEFFVNDAVSYQKENAIFTNANGQAATKLVLNGGVLTLESDLEDGLGIRADEDGTVVVAGEATLNASAVSVQSGKEISLTGDGTYTMRENANTLDSGVVLAEGGWKGTVVVNGAADALELGTLGTTGSTIDLGGADHKLATGDHTVTAKVKGADSSLTMDGGTLTLRGTTTLKSVYGADALSATDATISNGLTVDSISGDVTVSGGMVQEKTSGEAIIVNGELTLGSVTLSAVLNNGGNIVFDGQIKVDSSAIGDSSASIVYEDNSGTENNAHGFRKTQISYTVVTGAVGAVTDNASWTVDGIAAYYLGGKVSTIGVIDSTTYWLNANSGDYELSSAQYMLEAGNDIALKGGTLLVDTDLKEGVTISSITDDATGGTVNMNVGTVLSRNNLKAAEDRKITLTGSGAYLLEGNTDLGVGVELSDAWTGTVYTGELAAGMALDAAKLGTDGSTLWLGNRPMRRNSGGAEVVLKNLTAANVGDTVVPGALTLQKGESTANNLEVQGMLTLGTAASATSLTATGELSTQGITLGNIGSSASAAKLNDTALNLTVADSELLKLTCGSTTVLTLGTGYNGATTLNGEQEVLGSNGKMIYSLAWQNTLSRATAGSMLVLTANTNPTYVQDKVGETVSSYTHNGRAGLSILNDAYAVQNPQFTTPGSALAELIDAVDAGKMTDECLAAVAGASTAVLGQALSGDVERQLRAIRNRSLAGNDAATVTLVDEKSGLVSTEAPDYYFAWVNAEGNRAEQDADSTAAGYTLTSWGGTLGAGMQVNDKLTLGLAVTAMYGDLKSDGPDYLKGDMDTTYVSAFARYNSGAWSHAFIGTVGTLKADYTRTAMGYSTDGDTDGTAFGLMYEVSREFALSNRSCISPVFNLSYRHTEVDSYSESGTDAALNVGKQSLDTVTLALGARYAAVLGQQTLNRACAFEARALAKYDFGDTQTDTNVGFINHDTRSGIKSAELGAFGVELGAGISVPVGSGSIFADGAVELRSDYTNFNATVGYKIQF